MSRNDEIVRKVVARLAAMERPPCCSSLALRQGRYLTQDDLDRMRAKVLVHDFDAGHSSTEK